MGLGSVLEGRFLKKVLLGRCRSSQDNCSGDREADSWLRSSQISHKVSIIHRERKRKLSFALAQQCGLKAYLNLRSDLPVIPL